MAASILRHEMRGHKVANAVQEREGANLLANRGSAQIGNLEMLYSYNLKSSRSHRAITLATAAVSLDLSTKACADPSTQR